MSKTIFVVEQLSLGPHAGRPGIFALDFRLCCESEDPLLAIRERVEFIVEQAEREAWRQRPHKYQGLGGKHPCKLCTQFLDQEVHLASR